MYDDNTIYDGLAESKLGRAFSEDELRSLIPYLSVSKFEEGELIAEKNTPASFTALLLDGGAEVIVNDLKVASLSAGDLFGEAMFSSEAVRMANIKSTSAGVMVTLTVEMFDELLAKNRVLAMRCKTFFEKYYAEVHQKNEKTFWRDEERYVALIAHNEMKSVLVDFVSAEKKRLMRYPLVATGTTGALLHRATGLLLSCKVQSGPLGGDQAVGAMIANGNIRAIIFFRDPLSAHPHHADIEALGRLSDVYHVPFATNPATAAAVLDYIERDVAPAFANPSLDKYSASQAKVAEGSS